MPPLTRSQATVHEAVLIVAIFAGWFIHGSVQAVLKGFPAPQLSDREALALVLFECFAFATAAAVLVSRGWRLRDFQFSVTWSRSFVGLLLIGVALLQAAAMWRAFRFHLRLGRRSPRGS